MTDSEKHPVEREFKLAFADGRNVLGYPPAADLTLLFEASRHILGYFLHTWFAQYLSLLSENMTRWVERGSIGSDGRPSEESDYRILFDADSLDIWKTAYLIGNYAYIYLGHKKSNYLLMREDSTRRVLYLRGYDYQGAVYAGGGLGMGYASIDTRRFNSELGELLFSDFEIFKILSPGDLRFETIDAQKYFNGDYDGLNRCSSHPIRSIYLNAARWQADIEDLVDRMDHFVVYVSSITESVLWELDLLRRKQRAEHTTVVLDAEAIANKELQVDVQQEMRERFEHHVLWSKKQSGMGRRDVDELRGRLSQTFEVVSPEEFSASIDIHKNRIKVSSGPLAAGSREKPVEFVFHPAVDTEKLERIRDLDAAFDSSIREMVASKRITNILWFLHNIHLKFITSIMLGKHHDTGRVMSVYAAAMEVALKQIPFVYAADDAETAEQRNRVTRTSDDHREMALYLSTTLMGMGQSHEFHSIFDEAVKAHQEWFAAATEAVEAFFREALRRRPSSQF
jgi:hypothetical protein